MSCTDDSKITVSVVVHGSAGDPDASSVTSAPAELASCLSLTEPTAPALGSHESLMRRFQLADTLIGRIAEQPEIRESLVTRLLDVELFVMQPIYLSHRFQEYSGEKLMVMDQHGNPLLFAVETNRSAVRRGCCCCCAAHRRPLQMMLYDLEERPVALFRRRLACATCWSPCCLQRAYLRDVIRTQEEHQDATDAAPSELFYGVIRQRWHPTRAEFVCSGIRGGVVLRVRGPRRGCCATNATSSFHILSMYGRARLGSVGARWRPLNVDVFRRSDNYGVQFDRGLPSRAKITLLGAAMLLDFLYFNV
ncbi:phospholipid scramblase 2-like [Pollicipes pollicipes]|uniref:phospholipid scramblase 2-like n=1 Tax=Pollicipes pollicipes TaxID=41117 RepID=UPI0018851A71|nr:phospholipid scramblase 2-like [Pollicipes pollicipes]